jgi:integrase
MPRITKPLTDSEIKGAKPKEKDYKLNDGSGLSMLVRKSGTKMWRFDYKFNNKNKSMSFGSYPMISLREAREAREKTRKLIYNGIDPIEDKKRIKEERIKKSENIITFEKVLDEWINIAQDNWKTITYKRNIGIFDKYLFNLKQKEFNSVTKEDLIDIFSLLVGKRYLETANKLFKLLNRFYQWAATFNHCQFNIVSGIDKKTLIPPQNVKNMPTITNLTKLGTLLKDIKMYGTLFQSDISSVLALQFAPYVALRPFNLRHLEWNEVNLDEEHIEIPGSKMKTKKDFILPLSKQAVDILRIMESFSKPKSKFVFVSPTSTLKPISDATLSHALARLGYKSIQTVHGFRATFSTLSHDNISNHGFYSDIIESCLAHADNNQIRAAYNRDSKMKYYAEKKKLMNWYGNYLDSLENN